jgi:hypothetical protein
MATTTELQADHEEVSRALAEKRPVDPEVAKRVHARAAAARELLRRCGPTNAAVSLIREAREE